MGKGGKYLNKKVHITRKKSTKKILFIILVILLLLIALAVIAGISYYKYLLSFIVRPADVVTPPTISAAIDTTPTEQYSTEETIEPVATEWTWPVIVSDENITNIMLVGQSSREGEEHLIADTMILCSINRETKTLTLTSLMRDMRLVWPKYVDTLGKTHTGNNRINMAYNMGYHWTGNIQDSMDLLEDIVSYNFGVDVERTVEIDFGIFIKFIDLLGGIEIDISEEELAYLQKTAEETGYLKVGKNKVHGYHALCYARMRKVGHGDYERTERQREVIISVLNQLKKKSIFDMGWIVKQVLPMVKTDMTNEEITNYALEFIPMLKDLKIQSQRIPFDGNEISIQVEIDGVLDNQIAPKDLAATARQLQESIGMVVVPATE